jgi:hypothetical protein
MSGLNTIFLIRGVHMEMNTTFLSCLFKGCDCRCSFSRGDAVEEVWGWPIIRLLRNGSSKERCDSHATGNPHNIVEMLVGDRGQPSIGPFYDNSVIHCEFCDETVCPIAQISDNKAKVFFIW